MSTLVSSDLTSSRVADNHERILTGETLMPITRDGAAIGCHAERSGTVVMERTTELAVESAADRAVAGVAMR